MAEPFFAVDVGGSSIKSALVIDGAVESVAREPLGDGLEELVGQLRRLYPGGSWGLCLPGLVENGRVRHAANLGIDDVALLDLLELPRPDVFVNDLVAATVGEAQGGTLALLQVGTGIAGRFAVDGRVPPAATGLAGEVGHLVFREGGRTCSCGRQGCAEAYGGWSGVTTRCAEVGRAATPDELLDADWAGEIVDDALEAIGFAAAALVAVHDPGTLRVGGGLAAAWGETLRDAVRRGLRERILPEVAGGTTVVGSQLGDSAALLGLDALARSER